MGGEGSEAGNIKSLHSKQTLTLLRPSCDYIALVTEFVFSGHRPHLKLVQFTGT